MRNKTLALLLAAAIVAALLMPATAFAKANFCVIHNGEQLSVSLEGALAHLNHGDDPCPP